MKTQESVVSYEDVEVNIESLVGVNAKLEFADIIPYLILNYTIEDQKQRLRFSANAGIKYLQVSGISVDLDGEYGNFIEQQQGVTSRLHDEVNQELGEYYLVPVFNMELKYVFN